MTEQETKTFGSELPQRRWTKLKLILCGILSFIFASIVILTGFFWYISGSPLGFAKFSYTYFLTTRMAMDEPPKEDLFLGMLKGLVKGTNDKHTSYLDQEEMKELEMHTSSTSSGSG